jgi:hypothetical protein
VKASFLVVALLAAAVSAPAFAAEADVADAGAPAREARFDRVKSSAYIVVFNRRIVRLRAPVLGVPVEQRAENASERIRTLLRAPGEHKVTTEQIPQGIVVKIDGHIAFAITHNDVERLGEVAEESLAADAVRQLELVIAEMKEARDPRALLTAAGWAALATGIWLAVLWVMRHAMRRAARRLYRYAEARGAAMRAAGTEIVQRERVLEAIHFSLRVVFWALVLLLTYRWLGVVLAGSP